MGPSPQRASNFACLKAHDQQLVRLGMLAEGYFASDPNKCLVAGHTVPEVPTGEIAMTEATRHWILTQAKTLPLLHAEHSVAGTCSKVSVLKFASNTVRLARTRDGGWHDCHVSR
jgi:hypothetical protein